MEDPYWLRFSEDETFEDTTRGRARRIMNENQKEQLIPKSQTSPYILYSLRFGFSLIILHQRERWLIILSA